ncbi:hypothetical protein Clacol_007109 [Clathrus columnatus]|uniref:Cupredoxin n=1 Tax=Clathrus columnatus TaxID=1419009 RepID=A0AAV5AIC9_9AGAM|nr:hypothetical protein Clacol_007109 [Clathrus columnatus]
MKLLSLAALILPAYVSAQDYGFDPSTPTTTSAAPVSLPSNVHQIMLGVGNGFTFTPNTITANSGDVLAFTVSTQSSANHGVVQSTPDAPCTEMTGGYDSGLWAPGDTFAVTINGTEPLYFYCPQTNPAVHCQHGMVLIVNPMTPSDITSFMAAATAVTSEATATSPQSSGSDVVATAVPSALSSSSSSSSSGSSGSSGSGSTTSGAIKGSVATTAGFLTAVFGFFFAMA